MGLKFFADHCVPASVIQSMRDVGHEVLRLKEHIPQDSSDPAVISKARELDAILISLNGDVGDIVTYPPRGYKGIIALQVRTIREPSWEIVDRLMIYLFISSGDKPLQRKAVSVEAHRIRIRE